MVAMDYVSIRVSTLRGDQKIEFNAYIKINDKMVLYLRRGDSFEGDRLKRLKEKKLRKMYILNEEEKNYRSYLEKNIEVAYDNSSSKDLQTRTEIIQGAQQNNTEEVFDNPENAHCYDYAKEAAGKYVNFILSNAQALHTVIDLENNDKSISHHGVTVATLAIALAQRLGINDSKKTQLLSLGALLHDYGHYNTEFNINQPLATMSEADKTLWSKHPVAGAQQVQDKRHFDQAVINIIGEHEETVNGEGPRGLREKEVDPLSIIVGSANAIDRLISFEGVPKLEAAKKLMITQVGRYPLKHIQLLNDILRGL